MKSMSLPKMSTAEPVSTYSKSEHSIILYSELKWLRLQIKKNPQSLGLRVGCYFYEKLVDLLNTELSVFSRAVILLLISSNAMPFCFAYFSLLTMNGYIVVAFVKGTVAD